KLIAALQVWRQCPMCLEIGTIVCRRSGKQRTASIFDGLNAGRAGRQGNFPEIVCHPDERRLESPLQIVSSLSPHRRPAMLTSYLVRCPHSGCRWFGSLLPRIDSESWRGYIPNKTVVTFECPQCLQT